MILRSNKFLVALLRILPLKLKAEGSRRWGGDPCPLTIDCPPAILEELFPLLLFGPVKIATANQSAIIPQRNFGPAEMKAL